MQLTVSCVSVCPDLGLVPQEQEEGDVGGGEDKGRWEEKAAGQTARGTDRGPLQLWQFPLQRLGTSDYFFSKHPFPRGHFGKSIL